MAYSTTYGYINVPGSSTNYITAGPYSAGAIAVIAERASVNDTKVTISCKVYLGFGSYSASYSSLGTGYTLTGNFWWTLDNQHVTDSCTLKPSSSTWSRTSSTLQRLTTTYSKLTQTAYPDVLSNTSDLVLTFSNWQSGDQIFHFTVTGAKGGYQEKIVTVACPTYHADVTIQFDANGGTAGSVTSKTKVYGTAITVPTAAQSPTRSGYTFLGWSTSSSATTATYTPGATYSAEGAARLYAVWQANTYTITYKANGGTGTMASTTYTYAESGTINLRTNTFIKTNYNFSRWNTASDGSGTTSCADGASWGLNNAADYTLYAQWTPKIYTITLNNDSATTAGTTVIYEKYNTGYYSNSTATTNISSITIPTKTNYTFGGYYTEHDGTGSQCIAANGTILSGNTTFTSNTILYAQWTVNTKIITYYANGGSGDLPSTNNPYSADDLIVIGTNNLIKTGATANGWNTNSSGTGIHYDDGSSYTGATDLALYAEWTLNKYTISYNTNGGTGAPSDQDKNYNEALILSSTKPTYANHVFVGWAENSVGGQIYLPGGTYTKNNNVTFYAVWEVNDFGITFNSNFLQDYNENRNQVAFGIEAADIGFNSHSPNISQGLYTIGIYTKSKILDEYGVGVTSGELMAQTVERAVEKASYSSGIMGSVYIEAPHTDSTPNISAGWYNYIYVPHRNGGNNGNIQANNCSYGSMLLFGMDNNNGIFRIRRDSLAVEKIYTSLDAYTRSSTGGLDWTNTTEGDQKVIMKSALAFWNGAYSGTSSNLTYCNKGAFGTLATKDSISASEITGLGNAATKNTYSHTSGAFGGILSMGTDGVVETGHYLDFHAAATSTWDYDARITASAGSESKKGGLTFSAPAGLTYGGATIKSFGWTQIGSGSNTTSKITFSSATTNYNEIMVVASTLRSGGYHLFSGILPATIIDSTEREFKLSGGMGSSTATNCGAWGKIVTSGFTPVSVWINNTAFSSSTTWYIYGR